MNTIFKIKLEKPIEEFSYPEFTELINYQNPVEQLFIHLKDTPIDVDEENHIYTIDVSNDEYNKSVKEYLNKNTKAFMKQGFVLEASNED